MGAMVRRSRWSVTVWCQWRLLMLLGEIMRPIESRGSGSAGATVPVTVTLGSESVLCGRPGGGRPGRAAADSG